MQPEDQTPNKIIADGMRKEYTEHCSDSIAKQMAQGVPADKTKIDSTMGTLKPLHLQWVKRRGCYRIRLDKTLG